MKLFNWLLEKWRTRPAEFNQSFFGSVLGAIRLIQGWMQNGFSLDGMTPEVQGALLLLISQIALIKTWLVAKKQRDPAEPLAANPSDGSVVNP